MKKRRLAAFSFASMNIFRSCTLEPIKKLRVILEGIISTCTEEALKEFHPIYSIALALDVETNGSNIIIPWPFEKTKENFETLIKPWLKSFPDFVYTNPLDKHLKVQKLFQKEKWEQFFIITSIIGVSREALREMQTQFVAWAMPSILKFANEFVVEEIRERYAILYDSL